MKIVFGTNTSFLDQHLSYLERVLLGTFQQHQSPAGPSYFAQFSLQPQPILTLTQEIREQTQLAQTQTAELADKNSQPDTQTVLTSQPSWLAPAFSKFANYFLGLVLLIASAVLIIFYGPSLFYSVFPDKLMKQESKLASLSADVYKQQAEQKQAEELSNQNNEVLEPAQPQRYLPEQNLELPQGDWLIIPLIGVHTQLQKTATAEEALETGVWWVPEFGQPGDLDQPMIVAGHRYGWKWWWRDDYWKYHSFYKLPELQPGDTIEIISDQRKWVYEIYAGEQGEEITDYQADIILYTCQFLSSPIRIFRYGKLLID